MFRSLVIAVLCVYGASLCAAQSELPNAGATASDASLEELRRSARDLWSKGHIAEAAKQYQRVLEAVEKSGHTDAHLAADLYANGSLAVEMDRLADAKSDFQRALVLTRDEPLSAAQVRTSIGALLALEGNFQGAESNLKSAIAGFTKHAGPSDLRTARAWNGLAWVYTASGMVDKASAALRKANDIAEKATPDDSVERIPFLDYHAEFYSQIGHYSEAERLWKQALAIAEKSAGDGGPQFDVVLLHLGHMYSSIGDYPSAREVLEQFLSIEAKVMPHGSLPEAVALGELGNVYAHLKDRSNAEPTLAKSIDMLRTIPGNVPLADALVGTYLGDYYMSQQRWSEAADMYKQALQMRQKFVPNTALVAGSMNALSRALEKLKQKAEAKRYRKEAEAILSEQHNPVYSGATVDVKSFHAR